MQASGITGWNPGRPPARQHPAGGEGEVRKMVTSNARDPEHRVGGAAQKPPSVTQGPHTLQGRKMGSTRPLDPLSAGCSRTCCPPPLPPAFSQISLISI